MSLILKYVPSALHLAALAYGVSIVRKLAIELKGARDLQEQMEEDHSALVQKVLESNDLLRYLKDRLSPPTTVESSVFDSPPSTRSDEDWGS